MSRLSISFRERSIRSGSWFFPRRHLMRFEWVALLALRRITAPGDQAWVSLDEIAQLPSWSGRSKHHIATNIGRYLQSGALHPKLVTARGLWSGPYRLNTAPDGIEFDLPLHKVQRVLQVRAKPATSPAGESLYRFTAAYVRAHWLFSQGRLHQGEHHGTGDTAYRILCGLVEDRTLAANLRITACLGAAGVLYRLGRIRVAREMLIQNLPMLRRMPDLSLRAHFHLKLAWAYQRSATGQSSDRAVKRELGRAGSYAERSGDRAALGLLADRTGLFLAKKGRHVEAVNQLCLALEAYLITGNYDAIQSSCANIGSIVHRLGPPHYAEARRWLLLSIAVARWMGIGRDDAHAEMILGKIYTELNNRQKACWYLKRAERVAEHAGNRINLADIQMVWGLWYQRFGTKQQLVRALTKAIRTFRSMNEFDVEQKEKYMERRFPAVWESVVARA